MSHLPPSFDETYAALTKRGIKVDGDSLFNIDPEERKIIKLGAEANLDMVVILKACLVLAKHQGATAAVLWEQHFAKLEEERLDNCSLYLFDGNKAGLLEYLTKEFGSHVVLEEKLQPPVYEEVDRLFAAEYSNLDLGSKWNHLLRLSGL